MSDNELVLVAGGEDHGPYVMTLAYKIRRKSDGLYSIGGTDPTFNKRGKVWASLGALRNHLNLVYSGGRYMHRMHVYDDCEVLTLKVIKSEGPSEINLDDEFKRIFASQRRH